MAGTTMVPGGAYAPHGTWTATAEGCDCVVEMMPGSDTSDIWLTKGSAVFAVGRDCGGEPFGEGVCVSAGREFTAAGEAEGQRVGDVCAVGSFKYEQNRRHVY